MPEIKIIALDSRNFEIGFKKNLTLYYVHILLNNLRWKVLKNKSIAKNGNLAKVKDFL